MKPSKILNALDLAWACRQKGVTFIPLFSGEAGLGKSAFAKLWVKKMREKDSEFGFIDARLNYLEPPDMIGRPVEERVDGILRTMYALPDLWPTKGSGLILFEEVNRANSSVMSGLMQVLTDRTIHNHRLPEGWVMAACINGDENGNYDVNSMDVALKDRFSIFDIEYDHQEFVNFIKGAKWHRNVIAYVESGTWTYRRSDEVKDKGKYIAPRTFEYLNNAEQAGVENDPEMHKEVSIAQLGLLAGAEYHKFVFDIRPVTAEDLLKNKEDALKRLKKFADPNNYKNDVVSVTVSSVLDNYPEKLDTQTFIDVIMSIPADQGVSMMSTAIKKIEMFNAENPDKKIVNELSVRIDKKDPNHDKALRTYWKANLSEKAAKAIAAGQDPETAVQEASASTDTTQTAVKEESETAESTANTAEVKSKKKK